MPIQEKIPLQVSPAIVSYDYTDLAENTGVASFYLCQTAYSGNTSYILTQEQLYSSAREVNISDTSITFSLTAFNLPQNIKGTGYLSLGRKTSVGTGSIKATLKNSVDGSIVAVSSPDTNATSEDVWLLPMTIPLTHFEVGEQLQLTIEDQNSGTLFIGVDPKNRDGTNITPSTNANLMLTASTLKIPFLLKT